MKRGVITEQSDFVRFMRLVEIGEMPGTCWIWKGNSPARYGRFSVESKSVSAHRWLYELMVGPIPDGLILRHKCDNGLCVNPDHLETGTHAENTADMYDRGRNPDRKGENHPMVRLSKEQVLDIRRRKSMGEPSGALASEYGVSRGHIGRIVRKEGWGHI